MGYYLAHGINYQRSQFLLTCLEGGLYGDPSVIMKIGGLSQPKRTMNPRIQEN